MKLNYLSLACLALCAIALGACGGGDSDGSATASSQVPAELEKGIQAGLSKGGTGAESVRVVTGEIDGDEATAEVKLIGGTLDGQTVEVVLSRGKKGWKLEGITKFVELDQPLLERNYEKVTKELPEELGPALVRCLTEEFGKLSQEKVEAMYLDGEEAIFRDLGRRCASN